MDRFTLQASCAFPTVYSHGSYFCSDFDSEGTLSNFKRGSFGRSIISINRTIVAQPVRVAVHIDDNKFQNTRRSVKNRSLLTMVRKLQRRAMPVKHSKTVFTGSGALEALGLRRQASLWYGD